MIDLGMSLSSPRPLRHSEDWLDKLEFLYSGDVLVLCDCSNVQVERYLEKAR